MEFDGREMDNEQKEAGSETDTREWMDGWVGLK